MVIKKNFLLGLLIGLFVGIILGAEVVHMAKDSVCPPCYCVDSVNVIPISDRGYFQTIHDALRGAEDSIHIVTFELKYYTKYPQSNENILVEDLINASNRGVDVRIIVDQYSRENNAFQYLTDSNVSIKYDSEDVTTHAKLIIIDGKMVILGSANLSYYGLERNNEVGVLIIAEHIARYFENYFDKLWNM